MNALQPTSLPTALKRRWWGVVAIFGLAVIGGYIVFCMAWHPTRASHWGIGASGALLYLLGFTRVYLPLNRPHPHGAVLPQLGIGNRITLLRGLLYGLLAGFLVLPPPTGLWAWVPGFLFTVAALTDLLDGRLARDRGETTDLGAKLDVEVDSVGIFVAFVLAVKFDQLPVYFAAAGTLYYAYRIILWVWTLRGGQPVAPPPRRWRSVIGGFEVGFLCVVLWPVFTPPVTTAVATAVMIPVLISFVWDGLITMRLLDVHTPGDARHWTIRLEEWGARHLPWMLRLVIAVCAVWYTMDVGLMDPSQASALQHMLLSLLLISGGLVMVNKGRRWIQALSVLIAGALLSLVAPQTAALIGVTTASFLLMMVDIGSSTDSSTGLSE